MTADVGRLQARLRRIEGQVRGLQRMLDNNSDCEEMLTQLMAVRGGLEQISLALLSRHIERCLLEDATVSHDVVRGLQQTLQLWARFGAPAAQLPDSPEL